jgi:hypothetical protein
MCAKIGSSGQEHCAITLGRSRDASLAYLSTGSRTPDYSALHADQQLNNILFDVAYNLQKKVLLALPVAPGIFLTISFLTLGLYGLVNRPFRAPASVFKHFSRNRTLDVMRIIIFGGIALAILFSFAIAVSASQMYAGIIQATNHQQGGFFTTNQSSQTLALHWLVPIACSLFAVGLIVTVTALSKVSVTVAPEATWGTTGAKSFMSDTPLERANLLGHAYPMGSMPSLMGLSPQPGADSGSMGGPGAGSMSGGMRNPNMGARGAPFRGRGGLRGAPRGMTRAGGGAMGRGRGMM